ncbi:MAG: acyl-CoA dehydrogenase [Actinomycetales bacterium]|nr:acyl-CoA dehydrogenase [Actinomycetales bacterium]
MTDYRPPIQDIAFTLEHVVGYDRLAELPVFEHADLETTVGILQEAGEFMAKVVAPANRDGDVIGAVRNPDGTVTTPESFREAYAKLLESGFLSVPFPEEFDGGGFPWVVGLAIQELLQTSSLAFALGPLLTHGAIDALLHYGSDEQKKTYLPKMVTGEWMGSMNLTEPQAGTDVGALTTKAVKNDDGTYSITGNKIFITYGEHDFTEQIAHLVLARVPGAPEGTKGISCFIVPKYLLDEDGEPGERNSYQCTGVEHKLGIHGSPTCSMSYEGATGYLIGEENIGMRIMFVMMNSARLSVGMQGLAVAMRGYQQSLEYAKQRVQGQTVTGEASIVGHPDVRRMLMTQKAYTTALRRLLLLNAVNIDLANHHPDEAVRTRASEVVGLLTPISKSWGTDLGVELSSMGLQIHGGMGFIEETGAAQHWRDSRITPIYEGTNGVQAADLVGRKMPVRQGQSFLEFLGEMREVLPELEAAGGDLAAIGGKVAAAIDLLEKVTGWMLRTGASGDVASVLAGSVAYQSQWGETIGGWLMAKSALAASKLDDAAQAEEQLALAKYYATHLLPKTAGLAGQATAGAGDLFALAADRL